MKEVSKGEERMKKGRGRDRQTKVMRMPQWYLYVVSNTGTSLMTAGGESFEAAVKEISDKSLSVSEGMNIHAAIVCIHVHVLYF